MKTKIFKTSADRIKAVCSFYKFTAKEFISDSCFLRASGLAYSSLLSLVPLSALVFSIFNAFGTFEKTETGIKKFILQELMPGRQEELVYYFDAFIHNTKTLGFFGLFFFLVTAVLLLNTISNNFNAVWGSEYKRGFVSKFTTYTSVIVTGSILIAASFAVSDTVMQLLNVKNLWSMNPVLRMILSAFPTVIIGTVFYLMIILIPEGRVRFTSAAAGAVSGAILWEAAKELFIYWTNSVIKFSLIYGSIAAIPLFLIWLYITWLIIMFALEITYIHQFKPYRYTSGNYHSLKASEKMLLEINIFFFICRSWLKIPADKNSIADKFSIPGQALESILINLEKLKLVHRSADRKKYYLPARALENINITEVFDSVFGNLAECKTVSLDENIKKLVSEYLSCGKNSYSDISVKDFLLKAET
jgi:membrane protein